LATVSYTFSDDAFAIARGVYMFSERGEGKKKNDIAKWEGEIGKSPTLSKLFTKVIKSQRGIRPPHPFPLSTPLAIANGYQVPTTYTIYIIYI